MKCSELVRLLRSHGWKFKEHGKKHDVYSQGEREERVPRHKGKEVADGTADAILKRTGIKK